MVSTNRKGPIAPFREWGRILCEETRDIQCSGTLNLSICPYPTSTSEPRLSVRLSHFSQHLPRLHDKLFPSPTAPTYSEATPPAPLTRALLTLHGRLSNTAVKQPCTVCTVRSFWGKIHGKVPPRWRPISCRVPLAITRSSSSSQDRRASSWPYTRLRIRRIVALASR